MTGDRARDDINKHKKQEKIIKNNNETESDVDSDSELLAFKSGGAISSISTASPTPEGHQNQH